MTETQCGIIQWSEIESHKLEVGGSNPSPATNFTETGELAEWSIAAVLKTVGQQCPVGSNPTLSAEYMAE